MVVLHNMRSPETSCLYIFSLLFCIQSTLPRRSPLATELDLLWDKYGEVKGHVAVLEARRTSDTNKVEALQQRVTDMEVELTDIQREVIQINQDIDSLRRSILAQGDDGGDDIWNDFDMTLKQGSVQMNATSITYSVTIETENTVVYVWNEDHVPILEDSKFTRTQFSDGTTYTLQLRRPGWFGNFTGEKQISLRIDTESKRIFLVFNNVEYSYFQRYKHKLTYRISPISNKNHITVVNVDFWSKHLQNRTIQPFVYIVGLNESQNSYDAISASCFLGKDGGSHGPSARLINITGGSSLSERYSFTYNVLNEIYENGAVVHYRIEIINFDDVFLGVQYIVRDANTFRHDPKNTFPVGSFAFLKNSIPEVFKLQAMTSSVLYCSAVGNPPPRMSILILNRDGTETTTRYPSVMYNSQYMTTIRIVINPTTPSVANQSFVCAATSGGTKRRLSLMTKIVSPPQFTSYDVTRGEDELVIVRLYVRGGDPPKPAVSCRENNDYGDFLWGKDKVYTANETSTSTGYIVTFSANMAATSSPPSRFICSVFNENGQDRIIVPVHVRNGRRTLYS